MRSTLYLAALLMAPVALSAQTASPATAPTDAQLIAKGRQLTDWWYAGQADSITEVGRLVETLVRSL